MAIVIGGGVELLYLAGAALAAMILVSPAGQQATKEVVQSAAQAINDLSQPSQSDAQDQTAAPAVPTTTEECKDPCKDLKEKIEEVIAELRTRWWLYKEDEGGLPETKPAVADKRYGLRSRAGERQQYEDKQQQLRNLEEKWNQSGCGPDLSGVWEWLTKKLDDSSSTNPYDKRPPK